MATARCKLYESQSILPCISGKLIVNTLVNVTDCQHKTTYGQYKYISELAAVNSELVFPAGLGHS